MERFVADERTGLKYELVGDYYLIAGDDEPETPSPWITPLQMSSFLRFSICASYCTLSNDHECVLNNRNNIAYLCKHFYA